MPGFRLLSALLAACVLFGPPPAHAQSGWDELSASPRAGRHNDAFFVDARRGWIVNGDGEVWTTGNGGQTWTRQLRVPGGHFRSVGFLDDRRGFVGAVGLDEFGTTDPNVLYQTEDGGATWTPVTNFAGEAPPGLCGLQVVDDSTVVAVGRVRGPATFARTVDGGQTWTARDMGDHAAGLIDVHFTHPDSGYAVGLTDVDHEQSSCVVLHTDDGGTTWTERFRSSRTGEWCWKLSWPSRRVGYASLQRNSRSPIYFLKTVDGGATWTEELFLQSYYFVQGIGFVDEQRGWIGGNSTQPIYATTDGGLTWRPEALRPRLNRFRFLGDSLGYAVGRKVHRWDARAATTVEPLAPAATFVLEVAPNPSAGPVALRAVLPAPGSGALTVYDLLGRRVAQQPVQFPAGPALLTWDGRADDGTLVAPGHYLVRLRVGDQAATAVVVRTR